MILGCLTKVANTKDKGFEHYKNRKYMEYVDEQRSLNNLSIKMTHEEYVKKYEWWLKKKYKGEI